MEANRSCSGLDYSQSFAKYKTFLNKVARFDIAMFDLPKDASILDVGCGFGDRLRLMTEQGYTSVAGVDIDPYAVAQANDSRITVGDVLDTKQSSQSFDAVLVENVFHHISDYEGALAELARILKNNGVLCFMEPRNSVY